MKTSENGFLTTKDTKITKKKSRMDEKDHNRKGVEINKEKLNIAGKEVMIRFAKKVDSNIHSNDRSGAVKSIKNNFKSS